MAAIKESVLRSAIVKRTAQGARGSDRWLSDGGSRGAGRLVAKIHERGATFYFRYFKPTGAKGHLFIADYDRARGPGQLVAARDRASDLSRLYRGGIKDLHAHFEQLHAAAERERQAAEEAARRALEEARQSTLAQLLEAYVGYLEGKGATDADDVRRLFRLHVTEASPELAARRATDIGVPDFVRLIAALVAADKGRTAGKLRSYLRAAYALALRSKTDPAAPIAMQAFGIVANPLASVDAKSLSRFNHARTRTLQAHELGAFVRRLRALPASPKKDALSLCLLLGGQRPTQLLRLAPADVDLGGGTVALFDRKGARLQARRHVLPMPSQARAIVARRLDACVEDAPFFTNDNKRQLRIETVTQLAAELSAAMREAGESREGFELRDIRRTCETMLASLGVPSDVRAMILSHGLGGVQKRHYDFYEYALEMRAALGKWQRHIDRLAASEKATVLKPKFGKKAAAPAAMKLGEKRGT